MNNVSCGMSYQLKVRILPSKKIYRARKGTGVVKLKIVWAEKNKEQIGSRLSYIHTVVVRVRQILRHL